MEPARRKKRLKELLEEGLEIRSTAEVEENSETIAKISKIIREVDQLNLDVNAKISAETTTEVVMDAQVVKMSHELVGQVIQHTGTTEFSEEEFANAIISLVFKDDKENWEALAEIACNIALPAKCSACLLGSFDIQHVEEQKAPKERAKRSRGKIGEEVRPESVSQLDKQEKGYENVNYVLSHIKELYKENGNIPIPYYNLILHPTDFMATADNAFQISFLAKDESLAIEMGEDGYPTVRPTTKSEKSAREDDHTNVQAVVTLTPKLCQDMVKKYKIKSCLLTIRREQFERSRLSQKKSAE